MLECFCCYIFSFSFDVEMKERPRNRKSFKLICFIWHIDKLEHNITPVFMGFRDQRHPVMCRSHKYAESTDT